MNMRILMKRMRVGLVLAILSGAPCVCLAQERAEIAQPPNGNNQKAEVAQWIGPVKVSIVYHSPKVHGPSDVDRSGHIWGELVNFGFFNSGLGPSTATP